MDTSADIKGYIEEIATEEELEKAKQFLQRMEEEENLIKIESDTMKTAYYHPDEFDSIAEFYLVMNLDAHKVEWMPSEDIVAETL